MGTRRTSPKPPTRKLCSGAVVPPGILSGRSWKNTSGNSAPTWSQLSTPTVPKTLPPTRVLNSEPRRWPVGSINTNELSAYPAHRPASHDRCGSIVPHSTPSKPSRSRETRKRSTANARSSVEAARAGEENAPSEVDSPTAIANVLNWLTKVSTTRARERQAHPPRDCSSHHLNMPTK